MMIVPEIDAYNSFKVTFKPNCALSAANKQKVVILLTVIPCVIGVAFSLLGAWLVLPFVGMEIAALAYAFYYVNRHEADYESISIEGDSLVVERCIGETVSQQVVNPYWVKIVQQELANGELHLYLQSHGKDIEIGRYLTRKQRELLARQLKQRTGVLNISLLDKK
jgi:uncharacterized membrane protein